LSQTHFSLPRSLADIAIRDEVKEVLADARPQAAKNRKRIHWNTLISNQILLRRLLQAFTHDLRRFKVVYDTLLGKLLAS
jgi:hypothetical protein